MDTPGANELTVLICDAANKRKTFWPLFEALIWITEKEE